MRVTTAFNRILALPGASVATVSFTDQGLVLGLRRRRRRRLVCPCGRRIRSHYDSSRRRWRHLDFGTCKVFLEAEVHRIECPACGRVRTEQVPWARAGAWHTRDFEDVAWLATDATGGSADAKRRGSLMEANTHVCSPSGNGHGSSRRPSGQLVDTDSGRQIHCLRRFISAQPTARPWERSRAG